VRRQRGPHVVTGRAPGFEHGAGYRQSACVLAGCRGALAGEFRTGLTNQPSEIGKGDQPQLVGRPDRLFGDCEKAAPSIDLDRRRMIAAAIFEGAPVLALEELLEGRQISVGDGEEGCHACPGGADLGVGPKAVDDLLGTRRDVASVRVAASVEIDRGEGGVADWTRHDADAIAALFDGPEFRFAASGPAAGVI
jgi:hypothetical protein